MSPARQLLWTARFEGVSYLVLLGVAMPLKYLAGLPLAVRVNGALHGLLFLAFVLALARVASEQGWKARRIGRWMLGSIIPFALFWLERELRDQSPDR